MALRTLYDVAAPAKLNLFLHVVGRRPDGYHLLQSVFVPIDWCDTLHFERRDDGRLVRHDLGNPLPDDDLCLRAARALQEASGSTAGADVSIDKCIPSGAGMGGGSSDAASTLLALNRLWGLRWPVERLAPLALRLGADVPFFLGRGPALVEGIGERLTPLSLPPHSFAVVKPAAGSATGSIFQSPLLDRSSAADIVEGFSDSGLGKVPVWAYGRNDLQLAAGAAHGEIEEVAAWLQTRFGNSRMTGSGSAVFARLGNAVSLQGSVPDEKTTAENMPPQDLAGLPAGWTGRICSSLAAHPLAGWAG